MALKPCRECGNEVSTWSDFCPHCGAKAPRRFWERDSPVVFWVLVGILVWLGLYAAATGTRSPSPSPRPSPQPAAPATIEENLARIDLGERSPSSQQVQPYRRLLGTLEGRCTEERTMIGDMATRATQLIEENYDRSVTTRRVLEELESATRGLAPTDCSSILAPLITMIGEGS